MPPGAQAGPAQQLPTLAGSDLCPPACASPYLLDEPDDADGLLLAEGQRAGQAVELPRELQGGKAIRGLGHAGAGGVAEGLPGAARRVQGVQGDAAQHGKGKGCPSAGVRQDPIHLPGDGASTPRPRFLLSPPGPGRLWGVLALGCCTDLTSLWRKRQLFRRLAKLPRQQVTSPYSCMILIISHMAEGAELGAQGSGTWSPTWGAGQRPTGQGRRRQKSGPSLEPSYPQCHKHSTNAVTSESLEWATLGSCPRDSPAPPSPASSAPCMGNQHPSGARGVPGAGSAPPRPRLDERPVTALTLGGTVGEEGHQQGHVVDVLQVGPHLVDAPGQLGLQGAEMRVASGPHLPHWLPCPGPALLPTPRLQGHSSTRLQSSRKLGRSLSVGWKLMRSE